MIAYDYFHCHRSGIENNGFLKPCTELSLRRVMDEQCSVLADGQSVLKFVGVVIASARSVIIESTD